MKMRIFKQNRLWRDKAVEMTNAQGSKLHWRRLNDQEFDEQLRVKLLEEAEEVRLAPLDELAEELSDVCEVIDALCALHGFTREQLLALQHQKRAARGGFEQRIFAEKVEHPIGSAIEAYFLKSPEKHLDITDSEA